MLTTHQEYEARRGLVDDSFYTARSGLLGSPWPTYSQLNGNITSQ